MMADGKEESTRNRGTNSERYIEPSGGYRRNQEVLRTFAKLYSGQRVSSIPQLQRSPAFDFSYTAFFYKN